MSPTLGRVIRQAIRVADRWPILETLVQASEYILSRAQRMRARGRDPILCDTPAVAD